MNVSLRKLLAGAAMLGFVVIGCENGEDPSGRCALKPESGSCYAYFTRYYYDQAEKQCKTFVWGGCGGVVPFETLEACQQCSGRK
ncbi:hypothetical protein GCM10027347_10570 [Larkinella harenae]